ncbi:hypothetical protein WMY93_034264, partial [Mugilogobius chulae]
MVNSGTPLVLNFPPGSTVLQPGQTLVNPGEILKAGQTVLSRASSSRSSSRPCGDRWCVLSHLCEAPPLCTWTHARLTIRSSSQQQHAGA